MNNSIKFFATTWLIFGSQQTADATPMDCAHVQAQSHLRSKILDQPQAFMRSQLTSPGSSDFHGTQRISEAGISIDLAAFWNRVEEYRADELECEAQSLLARLRSSGPDLLIRSEITGLQAMIEWNSAEERRLSLELDGIEKRLKIGKESLLNKEKTAHSLFKIQNRNRSIQAQIVRLESQLSNKETLHDFLPLEEYSRLLDRYQLIRAKALVSRVSANRDNWSLKISAGVSTDAHRPSAANDGELDRFVEAQLTVPIFAPVIRPLFKPSVDELVAAQTPDTNSESTELRRLRNIEQEISATVKLVDAELTSYRQRESELNQTLATVSSAGGTLIQPAYQQVSANLAEVQEHIAYLKAKKQSLLGSSSTYAPHQPQSPSPDQKWIDLMLNATSGNSRSDANGFSTTDSAKFRARSAPREDATQNDKPQSHHTISLAFDSVNIAAEPEALESGEIRNQLGFFFRAQNQCNLVYVMLRLESAESQTTTARLHVQEKANPGKSTHEECLNQGYRNLSSSQSPNALRLASDRPNILKLEDAGQEFSVWLNDEKIGQFSAKDLSLSRRGYVGVRSDNIKWRFKLSEAN